MLKGLPNSSFTWDVCFADVQTLNEMVRREELDVAKVSCGVVPSIIDNYNILSCGGAIGYSCGPLLLGTSKNDCDLSQPVCCREKTQPPLYYFVSLQKKI